MSRSDVNEFLMTLITVKPFDNKHDEKEQNQFQVPIDDLNMPLADLYDIIFSLTDIPPAQLILHHNNQQLKPPDSNLTLSQSGITLPTTIQFSKLQDTQQQAAPPIDDQTINDGDKNFDGDETADEKQPEKQPEEQSKHQKEKQPSALSESDKNNIKNSLGVALFKSLYPSTSTKIQEFTQRINFYYSETSAYDDPKIHAKVLSVIPVDKIKEEAENDKETESKERAILKGLLKWFKQEFFTWVDAPSCWQCSKKDTTKLINVEKPSAQEHKNGRATRTEVYICQNCQAMIRFARHEDAFYLFMNSRKGRCGEWAKAFTLCCKSLGFVSRMVHDWTDHVWTEVFLKSEQKWIHLDSCEQAIDQPLLYESGWGKKLTYCIAVGNNYVMDVTKRYSDKLDTDVGQRRFQNMEVLLAWNICKINDEIRKSFENATDIRNTDIQWSSDVYHLNFDKSQANNDKNEGRQSGSAEWIQARGEDGSSSSSSPPR